MLLKSLEIYGFKSFAERTKIEFDKGITGIVGPNGSGKSNILDAIKWVLGEQSAKSLRGDKMEDIIFAGTQNRKSLGFAEVSLTLDNSSGELPVEFTEVTVTRRLYRSGESEYYINKTQCRLKDISELFMDTGVGKEGYSIIGQGKIDQILSDNTEDRRAVLEEAAGIVKYKTRREEAQRKLIRTEENLTRVEDILYEISNQIDPLKEESEKAKRYLDLREDLKFYELNQFVIDYNRLSQKMQTDREQIELLQEEIHRQKTVLAENEQKRQKLKASIDNLNKQIEKNNIRRHDIERSINILDGRIGINNEKISQAQNDNIRLEDEINTARHEIDIKRNRIEQLDVELIDKKNDREVLLSKKEKYLNELKTVDDQLAQYREEVSRYKYEFDTKKERLSKGREQIVHMETEMRGCDERIEQIQAELAKKSEQLEQLKANSKEHKKDIKELTCKLATLREERKIGRKDVIDLKEKVAEVDSEIAECSKILENKRARLTVLREMDKNHEGYYRSVRAILSDIDKGILQADGIYGVVAQLIEVPEKLEKAIEMALGSSMQFIITESEEDAKKAIDHLKKNKYGRATFLPITSVSGRGLSPREEQALKMDGSIGVGSELVRYDDRYTDIFRFLLGRILIVDTMDHAITIARRFSHRFKIVTLDGDVVNTGGSMSGGSSPGKGMNLLARRREIEELDLNTKKLEVRLRKLHEDKKDVQEKLNTKLDILKQLEERIAEKNMMLAVYTEKAQGLEKNIDNVSTEIEANARERNRIEERRKKIENQYTLKCKEVDILKNDIKNTSRQMEGWELDERKILKNREEIDKTLTNVKVQLASIQQEIISKDDSKDFLIQEIDKHTKNISGRQEQIKRNKELYHDLDKKNDGNMAKIKDYNKELKLIDKELEEFMIEKKMNETDIQVFHDEYKDLDEQISALIEKKHGLDIRISRTEVEIDNIQNNMWDDYNISYSEALNYYDKALSRNHINKQIKELKTKIKALGEVSVNSIEQYKQLNERYSFLQNQKFDLEMAMDDLQEVIGDITKTMERQFKQEIQIISEYFNKVFCELFGGGTARLVLKDESRVLNSQIQIEAQPPGKKLQSISLLSGGEKALTAISLLFGILKRKPCPFCVLDEIDAPLDEGNLGNFCKFLNNFTEDTQFVIITHRKTTMEASDVLYGITMEEKGVSRIVSVRFDDIAS